MPPITKDCDKRDYYLDYYCSMKALHRFWLLPSCTSLCAGLGKQPRSKYVVYIHFVVWMLVQRQCAVQSNEMPFWLYDEIVVKFLIQIMSTCSATQPLCSSALGRDNAILARYEELHAHRKPKWRSIFTFLCTCVQLRPNSFCKVENSKL